MSSTSELLEILQSGESITAREISQQFGVKNPYDVVRRLREQGYVIYCNERTNELGGVESYYRIGTPTRSMIAEYYRIFGA